MADGSDDGSDESSEDDLNEGESNGTDASIDSGSELEPDFWVHYSGPILTKLSVEIINQHLTRELCSSRLNTRTLADISKWWPKTKVTYRHSLDKNQVWILTYGVTSWWEKLLSDVEKKSYRWPRSIASSTDRRSMRLRIEEIYCEKKKHSVRAEREMKEAGVAVSSSKVYRLDVS